LPDLVGERLSRDRDVAVNLDLSVGALETGCADQTG